MRGGRQWIAAVLASILFLTNWMVTPRALASSPDASHIATTERFAFYSNFWLNLHHFLYNQAQRPADGKLEGGRSLSSAEWQALNEAVAWYREHLAEKDLLLDDDMYAIKRALIRHGPDSAPDGEAIAPEHRAQLEATARVYRQRYWPRHDRQNRAIFAWHEQRIRALEASILDRIAALAREPWPAGLIRVDLTWDANWAGAYCTTDPIHAVITSRPGGPDNTWPPAGWFELLFHEPSHALIDPQRSAVGQAIIAAAEGQGVDVPGQLWHAVLFYLSGAAVREGLAGHGIEHTLLMADAQIFARYHAALFTHMPAYVSGDSSLEEAMSRVVEDLTSAIIPGKK